MNKDDIKKLIAKKIGVSSSESDLASQILLDSIAENLSGTKNAVKIDELGIFQVTEDKKELIYSPADEQTGSFYMRLNVPNPPSGSEEFDEDIFSLGVDKPTVPLNRGAGEPGETSFLVIRKQIEERVRDILAESDYYENFDLIESFGITSAGDEEKPFLEENPEDEPENVFNIKEEPGDEEDASGQDDESVSEDKNVFGELNNMEDEETPGEPLQENEEQNNMKSFFERLNEIESKEPEEEVTEEPDVEIIEESEDEVVEELEEEPGEEPEQEEPPVEEDVDANPEDDHFKDPIDFYSYPERDEEEEEKKKQEEQEQEGDADYETLKNLMGDDDEDEPEPVFEEPRVLNSDDDEDESAVELEDVNEDKEDSVDWNWGDEMDEKDEQNSPDKDAGEEDPFDTLERTLMEDDDVDDLNLEEAPRTRVTEAVEGKTREEVVPEAVVTKTSEPDDDLDEDEKPGKKESIQRKLMSYRDNTSAGSLIVIAAFVIIVGTILYFLFFSGGTTIKESTDIPDQEEILQNSSDVSSTPEPEEASEGVTEEINEPVEPPVETQTPVTNETAGRTETAGASNSGLYREYPDEVRISNLISKNGNSYSVQVSSWKNPIKAENETKRLRAAGYDAYIINAYLPAKGGTWHRVRIGGFKSVEEARKFSNEYQN